MSARDPHRGLRRGPRCERPARRPACWPPLAEPFDLLTDPRTYLGWSPEDAPTAVVVVDADGLLQAIDA